MTPTHIKYHRLLAEYFKNKPLYFDEPNKQKPNTRKCVELPWQFIKANLNIQLKILLENIRFWQTRSKSLNIDPINDYRFWVYVMNTKEHFVNIIQIVNGLSKYILFVDEHAANIIIKEPISEINVWALHKTGIYAAAENIVYIVSWEGRELSTIMTDHILDIIDIIISNDGSRLITQSIDTIKVIERDTGMTLMTLSGTSPSGRSLIFDKNTHYMIQAGKHLLLDYYELFKWDLKTGSMICRKKVRGKVYGLISTPNNRLIWIDEYKTWTEIEIE